MRRRRPLPSALAVAVALAAACGGSRHAPAPARTGPRHVVIVSVDGMMPSTYVAADALGLRVPTLRRLMREGTYARAVRSVFPSVTYPAHTTIATGAEPAVHGITNNRTFDPLDANLGGWRWYAEDIRAPTIWDAVTRAGLDVALVNWPVTVGARVRWLVPEYWRAGTPDDAKLTRALSTPGLLEEVAARFPDLWQKFTPPDVKDEATTDIAVHLIERERPALLMMHIWETDDAQHEFGPGSAEARAALERADAQLGRLVAAIERAGLAGATRLIVVSDHGFLPVARDAKPGVLLARAGLVTLGADGKPTAWRAVVQANGGQAYVYVADPADEPAVRALFAPLVSAEGGLAAVYGREEIRARGGDPEAALALDAADGVQLVAGYTGEYLAPSSTRGAHGHDPERAALRASFLMWGAGVEPGAREELRLTDVKEIALAFLLPGAE